MNTKNKLKKIQQELLDYSQEDDSILEMYDIFSFFSKVNRLSSTYNWTEVELMEAHSLIEKWGYLLDELKLK